MSFDPFGDFETRGYLRNVFGEKDPDIIKHLEHSAFVAGIAEASTRGPGRTGCRPRPKVPSAELRGRCPKGRRRPSFSSQGEP